MKRVFKRAFKIVRFLGKPLNHRGFSRVDLFVLLWLGLAIVASLLLHVFQPASAASASTPQLAQAQVQNTSPRADTLPPGCTAEELGRFGPIGPCTGAMGSTTPPTPTVPLKTTNPCPSTTSYQISEGNVKDPFGGNAYLFFFTDPGVTVNECHITALVGTLTFVVNTALALIFVLVGIRLMLGGSVIRYASALEILPGVLLAIVGANLVLPIAQLTLDANNSLTQFVYTTVQNMPISTIEYQQNDIVTKTCNHWDTLIGAGVGSVIPVVGTIIGGMMGESIGCNQDAYTQNWQQTLDTSPSMANPTQGASPGGFMFAFDSMTDMLQFVLSVMILMLLGQMAMRLLLIDFFIATGPIGLGASALPGPGGKLVTKLWLQGFLTTIFVQFLQVIALIVVRLLIGTLTSGLYASLGNTSATNNDATLLWVMQIAEYWFILRVPGLLRLGPMSPMNMVMEYGQTMAQTVQSTVDDNKMIMQETLSAAATVVGTAAGFIR